MEDLDPDRELPKMTVAGQDVSGESPSHLLCVDRLPTLGEIRLSSSRAQHSGRSEHHRQQPSRTATAGVTMSTTSGAVTNRQNQGICERWRGPSGLVHHQLSEVDRFPRLHVLLGDENLFLGSWARAGSGLSVANEVGPKDMTQV